MASGWRYGSAGALGVALLCQESALFLPAVSLTLAAATARSSGCAPRAALESALRATWPQLAVAALFALQRFVLIAPFPRHANYQSSFGWNVPNNALAYVEQIIGGGSGLALLLGAAAATGVAAWRHPEARGSLRKHGLALGLVPLVWLGATLLPFTAVRLTAPRFAIAAEIPLCFLVGGLATVIWSRVPARWRSSFALGLLAALLASAPYPVLAKAYTEPRGVGARALMAEVEALDPPLAPGDCLVVLYGGPGLLSDAWWVQREAWSGTPMLAGRFPGQGHAMYFHRMGRAAQAAHFQPECRTLGLSPELRLIEADAAVRRSVLGAGLRSAYPRVASAAAERLAFEFGAGAVDELADHAAKNAGIAEALLLIDAPEARAAAARLMPDAAYRERSKARLDARWREARRPS